jgi:hypothetical protein
MLASVAFGAGIYLAFGRWTLFIILAAVIMGRFYEGIYDRRR